MKTDFETNNFVGAGEDSAHEIIRTIFNLKERKLGEFPSIGVYRQVPLDYLLPHDIYIALRSDFQKGSIDILVITKDHRFIACRVQGKKGDLKMKRESLQSRLLRDGCINVVDIQKRECIELFKERVNRKSTQEVIDSFKTAGVEFPN